MFKSEDGDLLMLICILGVVGTILGAVSISSDALVEKAAIEAGLVQEVVEGKTVWVKPPASGDVE